MALVASLLGTQTFNTTSGTHTVVATPAVGDLIVIVVANTGNTASIVPTDTQSGVYTQVVSAVKASSADTLKFYVRSALIPAASSTTFSHAPGTSTGGGLGVFKITGASSGGAGAIRQSAKQDNQAAAGTPAPVFGSAVLTASVVIGAVFNATSPATLTPRTSFTEAFDIGYSTPTTGVETMFRNTGETGTTMTWGGTSASAFCSAVIEVIDQSLPTVALSTPTDTATVTTTTPALVFTGTDLNSDDIRYNVQVHTDNTFATPISVKYVDLKLRRTGTVADNLFIELRSGSITGTVLGTSNNVAASGISTTATDVRFTFATAVTLDSSTVYYLTIQRTGARDLANYIDVYYQVNGYANGTGYGKDSSVWTSTTADFRIVLFDASTVQLLETVTFANATSLQGIYGSGGISEAYGQSFTTAAAALTADVISGTDAGFSGTPDNTDPFTSGQAVTYTVQTALTNSVTYYWRVSGLDPSGSNTYGAYATTRSFTVSVTSTAIPNKVVSVMQAVKRSNFY